MGQPTGIAIVTGASRGLGAATARALVERGWSLIVDGRDPVSLSRAVEEIGDNVTAIAGDVADTDHRQRLLQTAAHLGGLDLLVNNASSLGPSPQPRLGDYPLEVLEHVYQVNLMAPLALIQLALPMLRDAEGVIVNITSDAATGAYEGWGGYGSSKAALDQMSNILAAEEPGISVYRYDPGDMNTQMHQEAFPGEDVSDRRPPGDSVPALMALVERRPPSGSYRFDQVLTR